MAGRSPGRVRLGTGVLTEQRLDAGVEGVGVVGDLVEPAEHIGEAGQPARDELITTVAVEHRA